MTFHPRLRCIILQEPYIHPQSNSIFYTYSHCRFPYKQKQRKHIFSNGRKNNSVLLQCLQRVQLSYVFLYFGKEAIELPIEISWE